MTTPVYTSPFTGTVVTPTDVSYYPLSFSTNQKLYWPATVNGQQVPAARIIDCTPTASGLSIALPAGNQGTVGADILFRNLGGFSFLVTDSTGGNSFTVPIGISKYVYLTDNSTATGIWNNVTFAAGTSVADAASLAGAGLTTVSGQLATTQNVVDVTSSPTINNASRAATFVWGAGAGTFTLPVGTSLSTGWFIGFRNNGTGALTINPQSPSLLNSLTTITANPGDSGFIFYDVSTNSFYTVGFTAPSNITFTAATYDVDAIPGTTYDLTAFAPIIQTYIAQSNTRTATLAVTLPAITQLYVLSNNTGHTNYNITFKNQGSSSPALIVSAGNIATVLSDGTNLYLLTQASSGLFYAANGSQTVPSFSFNTDTTTGMYLVGTSILGLTANSNQIMKLDNSNLSQPLVTVTGRLTASSISGGTF